MSPARQQLPYRTTRTAIRSQRAAKSDPGYSTTAQPASSIHRPALSNQALQRLLEQGAVQAKLEVGPADDAYEREADSVAERLMRMREPAVQRACTACAQEEEKKVYRKASAPAADSAERAVAGLGHGAPLPASERVFFEGRIGRGLGDVRVHHDGTAAAGAASLGARAFTLGTDIAFARGAWRPGTFEGRKLLAHELTHVIQQDGETAPVVRRLAYGTGTPPSWAGLTLSVAPAAERPRIDTAITRVDDSVNHPDRYAECHRHFAERCPGGTTGTLASVWARARLWKITSPDPNTLARGDVSGSNLAYTQQGYDGGSYDLAQTLMHEAGHNCGIPRGSTHWRADQIATYCMGAGRTELSLSVGHYIDRDQMLLLYSYRRFLGDWASGRGRATLGADLNIVSTAMELGERRESARPIGEFGSLMGGFQGRLEGEGNPATGGWGGPRFGGLTVRVETGIGVGRFSLRPAGPGESRTAIAPSWVLQVGPRAEFLVPDPITEGRVIPLSIGAANRLAVPLNADAERLNALIFSLEGRF